MFFLELPRPWYTYTVKDLGVVESTVKRNRKIVFTAMMESDNPEWLRKLKQQERLLERLKGA
jgi:hypothetical protein